MIKNFMMRAPVKQFYPCFIFCFYLNKRVEDTRLIYSQLFKVVYLIRMVTSSNTKLLLLLLSYLSDGQRLLNIIFFLEHFPKDMRLQKLLCRIVAFPAFLLRVVDSTAMPNLIILYLYYTRVRDSHGRYHVFSSIPMLVSVLHFH